MAHVRLIASALIVLTGCGVADAQPSSGIVPPPGWTALAGLANAARTAAAAPGVSVDGAEAWGDPAMGCYAVWVAVHGSGGDAAALAEQIRSGFAGGKLALGEVVVPSGDDGIFSATFERAPYKGRLRARVGGGKITAIACFANQREPIACDTACAGVIGGVR
jgi:hypothetical protein